MRRVALRFGKFASVGLVGAGLQLALTYVLTAALGVSAVPAVILAVEAAILHNFFWHQHFTWRDRPARDIRTQAGRLWRFQTGNGLVSLTGNALVTAWLAGEFGAPPLVCSLAGMAVSATANFIIADRWVYNADATRRADA